MEEKCLLCPISPHYRQNSAKTQRKRRRRPGQENTETIKKERRKKIKSVEAAVEAVARRRRTNTLTTVKGKFLGISDRQEAEPFAQ